MSRRSRQLAAIEAARQREAGPTGCALCGHEYSRKELTRHHLVPKSRGGREVELICRPCHAQIHAVYTEKELEQDFGTLDSLRQAPKLQSWMRFVRRRKPTGRIRVKTSKDKGR